jgi:hypothetical protein
MLETAEGKTLEHIDYRMAQVARGQGNNLESIYMHDLPLANF